MHWPVSLFSRNGLAVRLFGRARALRMVRSLNRVVRSIAALTHRMQFEAEWKIAPTPGWYDHYLDLYGWPTAGNPLWLERGVFALAGMKNGARVLEIGCGDGFYTRLFYAARASTILAVDIDESAVAHARAERGAANVEFRCADIRSEMPSGPFDCVAWDAGIQYFTREEQERLLAEIGARLGEGVLCGYTIQGVPGKPAIPQHIGEFTSREDLEAMLRRHFANVRIIRTDYPSRTNLYFHCSNGALPVL